MTGNWNCVDFVLHLACTCDCKIYLAKTAENVHGACHNIGLLGYISRSP